MQLLAGSNKEPSKLSRWFDAFLPDLKRPLRVIALDFRGVSGVVLEDDTERLRRLARLYLNVELSRDLSGDLGSGCSRVSAITKLVLLGSSDCWSIWILDNAIREARTDRWRRKGSWINDDFRGRLCSMDPLGTSLRRTHACKDSNAGVESLANCWGARILKVDETLRIRRSRTRSQMIPF